MSKSEAQKTRQLPCEANKKKVRENEWYYERIQLQHFHLNNPAQHFESRFW